MIDGLLVAKSLVVGLGLVCFLLAIVFLLQVKGLIRGQNRLSEVQVARVEKDLQKSTVFGCLGVICLVLSLVLFVY
ncbi:hypothetical protein [Enterococcus diestrammenae]|uniref:hypothetical protein n=1 Tax=Enterococcus diestrammenae TaxID=1155073 RepID=UPI0022E51E21|nr:hypothetical protein [Enterococcus diestrammenae]